MRWSVNREYQIDFPRLLRRIPLYTRYTGYNIIIHNIEKFFSPMIYTGSCSEVTELNTLRKRKGEKKKLFSVSMVNNVRVQ
jgi:hypothetical protein